MSRAEGQHFLKTALQKVNNSSKLYQRLFFLLWSSPFLELSQPPPTLVIIDFIHQTEPCTQCKLLVWEVSVCEISACKVSVLKRKSMMMMDGGVRESSRKGGRRKVSKVGFDDLGGKPGPWSSGQLNFFLYDAPFQGTLIFSFGHLRLH